MTGRRDFSSVRRGAYGSRTNGYAATDGANKKIHEYRDLFIWGFLSCFLLKVLIYLAFFLTYFGFFWEKWGFAGDLACFCRLFLREISGGRSEL